ncbi:DUF4190 domain-containing protein [Mycobacterium sp. M1]|uniref:DUF4190 domain-containing protein n=1 Tax=Mycolicibacter acidiphilus TaxID=2835306 RepID=A0ABS5RHC7_9MYCO|nr:DUF4190 domain-containing protein [Mycolicibacter acidiphilus]MBS9533707.1 DUF4190 domain-containing protein [Mycolicibacter acidiphilus]
MFAFVFAPVGAVLGHLALHQIQRTGEQGRERAIIGLAVSYAITTILVIALVVWLVLGGKTSDAPQAPAVSTTASAQAPRTTVITAPPVARPTVNVGDLRVGDCVEVKKESRDKDDPNKSWITIYRAACEVRDGVAQVQQILPSDTCGTTLSLVNNDQTIFACLADFKG